MPHLLVQPSEDGGERGLLVQWDAAAEKGWHPVESGGSKGKPAKGGGRREAGGETGVLKVLAENTHHGGVVARRRFHALLNFPAQGK